MKSFLPGPVYDILKWIAVVVIDALVTFINVVFPLWNIPYGTQISGTLSAFGVLLGALLVVSDVDYKNKQKASISDFKE